MKNKYRIVTDNFAGYEVQVKYWWLPICWLQIGDKNGRKTNTHASVSDAEKLISHHKAGLRVVKVIND